MKVLAMPTTIYAPILGQSNANNMLNFAGDSQSGYTMLENGLEAITGLNAVSTFLDSNNKPIRLAVGGSTVDGNNTNMSDSKIWWYPDSNTPGGALLNAMAQMQLQYASLAAQGDVKVTVVWSQGEHNAGIIAGSNNPSLMAQRYENATKAVFNYIESHLGVDADFYMMETGYLQEEGALNDGMTPAAIANYNSAVDMVRAAQHNIANSNADYHLAVNYDDQAMIYETGDAAKHADKYHLSYDGYEVVGTKLAQFIAADLGYTGSLNNPHYIEGTNSSEVLSAGAGDDTLLGGNGNDTLYGGANNDYLLGGNGADYLFGEEGNDTLMGGSGNDKLFGGNGNDALIGEDGNDMMYGDVGNDFLLGGAGRDTIEGGLGNDTISGGADQDKMTGGAGADVFYFGHTNDSMRGPSTGRTYDRITDFEVGVDKIDLSNMNYVGIHFGNSAGADELRVFYSVASDRTYIRDDSGSDFEVFLDGNYMPGSSHVLSNGDFIF